MKSFRRFIDIIQKYQKIVKINFSMKTNLKIAQLSMLLYLTLLLLLLTLFKNLDLFMCTRPSVDTSVSFSADVPAT